MTRSRGMPTATFVRGAHGRLVRRPLGAGAAVIMRRRDRVDPGPVLVIIIE